MRKGTLKVKRVLYGGAFDLLHLGHVRAIKRAKRYGYLIVNVSSDRQVKQKKGEQRPIIPQKERIEMLKSLKYVDEVICFNTKQLNLPQVLRKVRPDILITNSDNDSYDATCKKFGVRVVKFPRVIVNSKLDTTGIIAKIRRSICESNPVRKNSPEA